MRFRLAPLGAAGAPKLRAKLAKLPPDEVVGSVFQLLAAEEASFALQLQVRPVSGAGSEALYRDAASPWFEPYLTVGRVVFCPQPRASGPMGADLHAALCAALGVAPASDAAAALHKSFAFHPVSTAEEHRPIGEVNQYRCRFYARHMHARLTTMQKATGVGVRTVPFERLERCLFGL